MRRRGFGGGRGGGVGAKGGGFSLGAANGVMRQGLDGCIHLVMPCQTCTDVETTRLRDCWLVS